MRQRNTGEAVHLRSQKHGIDATTEQRPATPKHHRPHADPLTYQPAGEDLMVGDAELSSQVVGGDPAGGSSLLSVVHLSITALIQQTAWTPEYCTYVI